LLDTSHSSFLGFSESKDSLNISPETGCLVSPQIAV
jgi:hypothetical protein